MTPSRIFITGSADGLGQMAARTLIEQGHQVTLHGRNAQRAQDAIKGCPGAAGALAGDLSSIADTKALASELKKLPPFDAVIHNAGLIRSPSSSTTSEGLHPIYATNTVAPYILTCLAPKPKRLVYLSSGLHSGGDASLKNLALGKGPTSDVHAYSDTKLHDIILANAVARRWPDVRANSVDPGWIATKMGGPGADPDLVKGARTQAWLAASEGDAAKVSGKYWRNMRQAKPQQAAEKEDVQEAFLKRCQEITGVKFPD